MEPVPGHREESAIPHDTWVVLPAYREATVIDRVITALRRGGWAVLVVDDGSDDATSEQALRAGATVLRHPVNRGQGAALQTAFEWAVRQPGLRYLVTFDADGQHSPADVEAALAPLRSGEADVVLGSRFLTAAGTEAIPPVRRLLLRLATLIARGTTGLALTDTHNGLRALTIDAVRRIRLTHDRMAHASELLSEISKAGCRVREIPSHIVYTEYSLAKGQRLLDAVNILWDQVLAKLR